MVVAERRVVQKGREDLYNVMCQRTAVTAALVSVIADGGSRENSGPEGL